MAIVDAAYEKWKKDFEAECPGLFKEGVLTGPETALRRDLMRTAYMAGKKAARQPVGEPVGYSTFRDGRFGSWLFQTRAMAESHDSTAVAGGPANSEIVPLFRSPAQAVDLGQFRRPIEEWRSDMEQWVEGHGDYDGVFAKDIAEANRLLALIDSQAVGK